MVQNNPFVGTKIASAKLEMEAAMSILPADVQAGLNAGTLKMVDAIIYSAKALNADTTIELMEASDNKKEGITNLNNRKLEALNYFLLKGIRLQTATVSGSDPITDAVIAAQNYDGIVPAVANGELEIIISGKTAYPRNSNKVFDTNFTSVKGLYTLECPRVVAPQSEIVPTLRLNASTGGRVVTRIELLGVKIIPA